METNKIRKCYGNKGETAAKEFLALNGYEILETNHRIGKIGEIDIIARDGEYLCFVEVKTRSSLAFGTPSESVTKLKQHKITMLAKLYISRHSLGNANIRFDIVEILTKGKKDDFVVSEVNVIKNAFCQH